MSQVETAVATFLVSESKEDNYEYKNTFGKIEKVKTKGLFLMTEEGYFIGSLNPEIKYEIGSRVSENDVRWRSRKSGFILMDGNSERLKDRNRFWVDVKNPLTKKF